MIIVALLADIPFFADLETNQLEELIELGRELDLKDGEAVFSQGDAPDGLYVLLSGQVRVFGTSDEGQVVEYATFEDNQFFGELALLDGKPRSASVSCLEDCEFFVIPRGDFLELLRSSTVMLSSVLSGLSEKIRGSNEKYFWERLKQERIKTEMEMERSRSLAQMVAGIAHEINTPLGIVRTAASLFPELLTESFKANYSADQDLVELFEDLDEASSLIQGNITRANSLVQSFKTLSVRQATDNWESVSLPVFLEELLLLYGAQTRGMAIEVSVDYDKNEH
ncbi:MAG: cyclic nucleotide-binding domain-containing protein, partial [Planctomycetota bacterium]|nr:cyclic nucleotide-binding domain-containing protein [Planctomycetota bacterium]